MPRTAIIADSSVCLPAPLLAEHRIAIVPLSLAIGTDVIADGSIPAAELFRRVEASSERPHSASSSPGDFLAAFQAAREAGADAAVCLVLSAKYSGTYTSALAGAEAAREAMPDFDVRVVDTGGLAMTHGFAALAAARAAEAGALPDDVARIAKTVGSRGKLIGTLDTMRYLVKGGRVPRLVGWATSVLRIKPILAFEDGGAVSIARPRTAAKARERLLTEMAHGLTGGKLHIGVMHADAPDQADALAETVRERFTPAELIVSEFTSVMAVHTGPGFLGVAFYEDECEEDRQREERKLAREEARRQARREAIVTRDTDRLEAALGTTPPPSGKPAVVVLVGLPGSGKSYFARALAARHPAAVIDSDGMRQVLFEDPQHSQREHGRVFPAIHRLMDRLLERGVTVIVDATNLKEPSRKPYFDIAERHGVPLVVVQVEAPLGVVRDRLRKRESERDPLDRSTATLEVFERLSVDVHPIQRPHHTVDTSKDMTAVLDKITSLLQS